MKKLPLVMAVGITALLLSGCSGQTGLTSLDRAANSEDVLPAFITLQDFIKRDSSRLLVTHDDVRYFGLQSEDARTTCVAVVPPGEASSWHLGCGDTRSSGEIVRVSGLSGAFSTILQGDDSDTGAIESGWTQISDNILIGEK
ncbi:hypothetical protein CVS30_11910 [Arthrobacter psychrolactophilus]|uniref:Lipoprotein n=1 Tax=Arthrobacter psychrolactophilus TaxID=92442 RepID=A0A2V5INE6_9MICC|nr:hypothetical protein [Arthrobacter psychrolactophilus]PYI38085.1 hypothetical protein CVS30_11910 [Arthrobacter psychrolactophilus]